MHSTALDSNILASSSFANSTAAFHRRTEVGTRSRALLNTLDFAASSISRRAACTRMKINHVILVQILLLIRNIYGHFRKYTTEIASHAVSIDTGVVLLSLAELTFGRRVHQECRQKMHIPGSRA
jgi:hypothetical protein